MSIPTRYNEREIPHLKGYFATDCGMVFKSSGKEMAQSLNQNGYPTIAIQKNKVRKTHTIHRLVATCFVDGKTEERKFVNHKNGIKTDNMATNLEWCTPKENIIHAHATGLCNPSRGEDHISAKLKARDVRIIRGVLRIADTFEHRKRLAGKFNVSIGLISEVAVGRSYLGDEYGTPAAKKKQYISLEDIAKIKALLSEGVLSQNKIAKMFGVRHPTVWKISKNIRHKE